MWSSLAWTVWAAFAGPRGEEDIAGTIDGEAVPLSELAEYTLDEWGREEAGKEALEHLIQVAIVEAEAERRGVHVSPEEVEEQIAFLEESIAQRSGGAVSLDEQLAAQGLDRALFRATLFQAIAATRMIRQDFELADEAPVPPEKQKLWYREKRLRLQVRTEDLPAGVAAMVGEQPVLRVEWGSVLFRKLSDETRRELFGDLATIRCLQAAARTEGLEVRSQDVDEELADRDEEVRQTLIRAGQSAEGVSYLQMLRANGQDPQKKLQSPKFQANILQRRLARHWYGADGYRAYFEEHKDEFPSLWDRRAEVASIFLRAAAEPSENVPLGFTEALEQLQEWKQRLQDSEEASDPERLRELFGRLAGIYSEHRTSRERGGLLGVLTAGQLDLLGLPHELLTAPPSSLHGPVRVARGAHLLLAIRSLPAREFEQIEPAELEALARAEVTRRVLDGIEVELTR